MRLHANRLTWRTLLAGAWTAICVALVAALPHVTLGQVTAERVDMFLQAAREQGYYDVAEYYLETLAAAPEVSAELKAEIPFRRAQLLFEKTRTLANISELRAAWAEAVAISEDQLAKSTDLNRRLQAIQLITQIHNGWAEFQRRQAQLPWERLAESPVHAEEARRELLRAAAAFEQGAQLLEEELRESRRSTDAARRSTFAENANRFLSHLLQRMMVLDRVALTYPASSPEFKQQLEQLVTQNAEYFAKYKNPAPYDMYFQMQRIRALLHLGRWQEAVPLLDDILLLEASIYRALRREVVLLGYDVWFREQPYKIELAIEQLDKIVKELGDAERDSDIGQRIRLALAKAHHQRTVFVSDLDVPTQEQRVAANVSTRQRSDILRQLMRLDSVVANEARELAKEWGMRGPAERVSEVSTFGDAKQAGLDVLLQGIELKNQWNALSEEERESPEQAANRDESLALADQALLWFDRSLELANAETRRVDLNMVRLYQCQAYWIKDYFLETALIGQFLLDRFPNELGTAEAAALAAQALQRLVAIRRADNLPVEVEQRQMVRLCNQVLEKWPERRETGDVAAMLIGTELDRKNLTGAAEVLARLAADNPRRPWAELRLGVASLQEADALVRVEAPSAEALQQREVLRQQALELLSSAMQAPAAEITSFHFVGAANLAQLLNDQQRYAETVALLEDSPTAGLRRIEQNDPLVADLNVQVNLIQNGVIAHMGRLSQTGDLTQTTDRVAALLELLQQRLQTNPRAAQILQSYYTLTLRKLRDQAAGDLSDEARQNLATATVRIFEPAIGPSQDWRLVSILGETLLDLAESLPDSLATLREQTLGTAVKSYERALNLTADSAQEPEVANFRTLFQVKLASALRQQEKFEAANTRLMELLKGNPRNPMVQIELCQLYQQWGIAKQDRGHLRTALMGQGRGTNAEMWGWQKLAQATITDAKNRATFYQALFGMVTCRFEFGKLASDDKYYEAALKAVKDQYERDKTMGGEIWYRRFDARVREIQRQAKRPANGLQGL